MHLVGGGRAKKFKDEGTEVTRIQGRDEDERLRKELCGSVDTCLVFYLSQIRPVKGNVI